MPKATSRSLHGFGHASEREPVAPDTGENSGTPHHRSGFSLAFADTIGVGLGLFPLGMAFGVLVVQAGLQWWWTPAFSLAIYAGSMEFVALGLVMALTPLAQIGLATFLVNFRHVFYGLTFPLHRVAGRGGRVRSASGIAARTYSIYALTDEVYALTSAKAAAETMTRGHILWLQAFCQAYWVVGGVLGALLGSLIPEQLAGLDFALTALFAVLAIDAFRAAPDALAPILALAASAIALVVAHGQMLMVAMSVYVVALIVRYLIARSSHRRAGGHDPKQRGAADA